jgi:hypothetical protein
MFYQLEPDVYATSGITKEPDLPGFGTSFLTGALIAEPIQTPMTFSSTFSQQDPPKSMAGLSIPLWSNDLIDLFRRIGVSNFQCFESKVIAAKDPHLEWTGYFAVNVLGLVSAADMSKSTYTEITTSPGGTPFAGFTSLVLEASRASPFDMFRLAENASTLVVSTRVVDALRANPRPGGWGISAIELDES